MTMTDEFIFDFMRASGEVEKIARAVIKGYGFDPRTHLDDISQDVRVDLLQRQTVLREKVVSKSYQDAVIRYSTMNALKPLLRERARQLDYGYPRQWIKDNLETLLRGLSIPTYAFEEDKLTGFMKQVVINDHSEDDLAVQADFNAAYLTLTDKQQEALSMPRETAAHRAAHSKALDRLCVAMNRANNKEEQEQ